MALEPRLVLGLAAAWVVAGLNLGLLFDLKATLTTLVALLVLNGLVLSLRAHAVVVVGFLASGVVFAAFIVQPAAAVATLLAVIWALALLFNRAAGLAGRRRALMLSAAFAALIWPPFLGLVSNSVVEIACPDSGLDEACYGFYLVGR